MLDISISIRYLHSSRIIAREKFERRRPANAGQNFVMDETRETEVPAAVIRANSLSLSPRSLQNWKLVNSIRARYAAPPSLLLPPRLQYTVSFVRFFTHFELHILLVDTVTFNPNLWFAGELLVEDFSRVWMDARFSGKLSLHHAATYIVLAYPIPKPAFQREGFFDRKETRLEIKSYVNYIFQYISFFSLNDYIYINIYNFNFFQVFILLHYL